MDSETGVSTTKTTGLWSRHAAILPELSAGKAISLGEGGTSLLELPSRFAQALGVKRVLVKCEHLNPTGSFKDRIAAVAASIAVDRGTAGLIGTSSGNGGAAAAAYAAAAGIPSITVTRSDVAREKLRQIQALGGRILVVRRDFNSASGDLVALVTLIQRLAAQHNLTSMITAYEYSPDAMRGLETIAVEIHADAPDATTVYAPVGGGGFLTGLHRGYRRLQRMPRLVAAQPAANPTLRKALGLSVGGPEAMTSISGLQVEALLDQPGAVNAVQGSGGHVTSPTDDQARDAQALLASAGFLVEAAGALSLAAALIDAETGRLTSADVVVLCLTGAGWKQGEDLAALASRRGKAALNCELQDVGAELSGVISEH